MWKKRARAQQSFQVFNKESNLNKKIGKRKGGGIRKKVDQIRVSSK